ncbi:flap endonuclease GEN [Anopheles maculipalpis]|uniref:flap endonuclease GEN n=1 Tax=Anopheles maculipalpis TaxID=1496333 RepID=UPI0021591923|nr:flap endonuclease GEN [Anopheles maculipalpis]
MGVKDLWNLLTPHMERKPLFELSNKVVAIDLSGWVCESLNVVDYFVHPRFYLRNLFFRTCYLLQTGITPVFVLEGTAPPLKYGVIVKRNQMQFRGARPKKITNCDKASASSQATATEKPGKPPVEQKRNRFHYVLKQCEELLSAMGLVCVQAPGEAEALCAYLNRDNLIHGVISQDSDCFAYGAVRVFRNFCASQSGGSVEIYDLSRLNGPNGLRLGQEKIVAMALLSGCDYCPAGVVGVGREMVTRFISCYNDGEILSRIRSWRKTADRLTELEIRAEDKNICTDCGHVGRQLQHRKAGCLDCRIKPGCNESRWKEQRCNIKTELDIKRKALKDPDFPHEPIINEFLTRPCELPALDLSWRQPNLVKFINSLSTYLQWNELYCFQKLLPLFTRWQVYEKKHPTAKRSNVYLEPDFIKKKRSPKGIASYEIVWKDAQNMFGGLIPQEQIDCYLVEAGNTLESLWSTIEPHDLVQEAYPELVEAFVATKTKASRKKKATTNTDGPQEKPKRKPAVRKVKGHVPLKDFLAKANSKKRTTADVVVLNGGSDCENQPNLLNQSSEEEMDPVDHFLNFTAELEAIAEDRTANDTFNSSAVLDRLCRTNYLEQALAEYMQIIETEKRSTALQDLLSQSVALLPSMEPTVNSPDDDDNDVQRRIVLKRDILNASVGGTGQLNQSISQLTCKKKRMSFFFEPLDIPPPDQQDYDLETEQMDMFECSLMLKDQVVVVPCDQGDASDINQTIIYDIDF